MNEHFTEQKQATTIGELQPSMASLRIRFKVLDVNGHRVVTSKRTGRHHRVAVARIADTTARIDLVLWDNDIDLIERGRHYLLTNAHVGVYNESMQLKKGPDGAIRSLMNSRFSTVSSRDMSKPFAWRGTKKKGITTGRTFSGRPARENRGYCVQKDF